MSSRSKTILTNLIAIAVAVVFTGCAISTDESATTTTSTIRGLPAGKVALDILGSGVTTNASARLTHFSQFREDGLTASVSVTNAEGVEVGILTLSDARVGIKQIKIKQNSVESESDSATTRDEIIAEENEKEKFQGPFVVDFLNHEVTPSLGEVDMIAGTYDEIQMKLHKIVGDVRSDDGTIPVTSDDPLYGNSIHIEGKYTGIIGSGTVVDMPFIMTFALEEEFRLGSTAEDPVGFAIGNDVTSPILIAFNLIKWFQFNNTETNSDHVDFSMLTSTQLDSGTTVIQLDENGHDANSKICDVIKKNIEESADYGKDEDGSGDLSDDEDDDLED